MKKYYALLLAFICFPTLQGNRDVYSRSFMFTKPGYYNIVAEQALWHDITYNKKGRIRGGLQLIPFFQQSVNLNKTSRYFLFDHKTSLIVAGDNTPNVNTRGTPLRDVRAEWLGLPSDFQGTLSLKPFQKQAGFTLEYSQDLKNWLDIMFIRDMYISIIMPVETVENNINLTQTNVLNEGTTFPQDIIQAFDQPSWLWGKMSPCKKRRTELAEIKILVGTSYESSDHLQVNYNTVIVLPIGKKQDAEYLFSPVVGNNHHLGIGAALNIQALMNRDTSQFASCFFLDLESTILIRNHQYRTFDLRGKPWSRFMQMNTLGAEPNTNVPGVNLLTRKATIKPFNVVDFAMGWRTRTTKAELEAGWGIWGHGWERVDHLKEINTVFGIAGDAPGTTASKSTIEQQAPNDPNNTFVPITIFDIDAQSGANGGALNFRAFFSVGMINIGKREDTIFGAGWSIDLPYKNGALQVWNAWLKLGGTF